MYNESSETNAVKRITALYKFAMTSAFNKFPKADKIIVLEDDLQVSPDFF